jgi:hypothetical protein
MASPEAAIALARPEGLDVGVRLHGFEEDGSFFLPPEFGGEDVVPVDLMETASESRCGEERNAP